eukprot:CAMPEP_0196796498 /NCGR_PEP_ID=MMETSP1104-20130614/37606_1 /TAXON_ID=33652 /ORGANISM="Cafeteria sp., Strain Caron Lab Isolate" /LENGTH=37 /DNA_ID= /DNA_START= /DNA_END= /DNA_ORIENTATION=
MGLRFSVLLDDRLVRQVAAEAREAAPGASEGERAGEE